MCGSLLADYGRRNAVHGLSRDRRSPPPPYSVHTATRLRRRRRAGCTCVRDLRARARTTLENIGRVRGSPWAGSVSVAAASSMRGRKKAKAARWPIRAWRTCRTQLPAVPSCRSCLLVAPLRLLGGTRVVTGYSSSFLTFSSIFFFGGQPNGPGLLLFRYDRGKRGWILR